jgi:hypothetical protein
MRFLPRLYSQTNRIVLEQTRVEAGWNNSTAALRVVRDGKREPGARGYIWVTLFLGDIKTGTWPSRLGESHKRQ